jgi:hypothetical protein
MKANTKGLSFGSQCLLVHDDHDKLKENIEDQDLEELSENLFDNDEHFAN